MTRRAAFAIAIWAAGCPGFPKSGPPPGPLSLQAVQVAQVRFPTATAESLESGRQLFLQHCNACHKFPALGEYSDEQWQKIVPRMAAKAKLSPADGNAILTFIQASRTASPMTAPAARNRSRPSQPRRRTTSASIIATCAAGPPNAVVPSLPNSHASWPRLAVTARTYQCSRK